MNNKVKVIAGLGLLSGLVVASVVNFAMDIVTREPRSCVGILKKRAEEVENKMVLPNDDGGLFLMTEGGPRVVNFLGYVGPSTVEKMRGQMIEAGLTDVTVKSEGTCQTESGLEYTVVSGRYTLPEENPDPI